MQAVLSLYATGRVTGVVLDAGDGVTHAVPIYEGFAMPHSIMRTDLAGRDVTRYLKALIRKEGFNFRTTAEFEIVKMIKEKVCYLATNLQKEESMDTDKIGYVLPDGNTLEVCVCVLSSLSLQSSIFLTGNSSSSIDWSSSLSSSRGSF
jgi:centractin